MASCIAVTGKPVLVPKPTSPASSITTPLHPCSLPSCPMGLPFPASGPPHTLFPLSGVLLQPHMSPHYLLITLQGSLSILESPWPGPGPVLLQSPPLRGDYKYLCVFVRSATVSLQPQGCWRSGTCLTTLASTPGPGAGPALPGAAQPSLGVPA